MSDIDDEVDFDLGLRRNMRWRTARRWILMAVLVGGFLELQGIPHVRLGGERHGYSYWSVTGESQARMHSRVAPLIAVLPLERPLIEHAEAAFRSLWQGVQDVIG